MQSELPFHELVDLELDEYSKLTMTYTKDGFDELTKDIAERGQLVPIILREHKILDGRHRHEACKRLGIGIKVNEVGVISDEEALDIVISNSLNKATGTDAAKVEAYLLCKAKGIKNKDMPSKFKRLNINYVRKLSYIEKVDPRYLQALLRQNGVELYNKEYKKLDVYTTINGVWKTLKSNSKYEEEVVEVIPESAQEVTYATIVEDYMVSTAAEEEYWYLFKLIGSAIHPDSVAGKAVMDLINNKHRH